MAAISFGIGQDATVDLVDSNGQSRSFSNSQASFIGANLMDFQADPIDNIVKIEPIGNNGYTMRRKECKGWKGTINVARVNGVLEGLEIADHNLYHTGQAQNIPTYSIHLTVGNADGSGASSEYEFTNCVLMTSKGANYRSSEAVTMTIEFEGDDCIDNTNA